MKVLILGIDALEYNLVEEWDLQNLKQKEYGKVKVPITKGFEEPATTIVWPCLITGEEPEQMGYTSPVLYRQPFGWLFNKFYLREKSKTGDTRSGNIMKKRSKKRDFLDKLSSFCKKTGISHDPSRKDIKAPTIFDSENLKTKHFHIPVYDNDAFPEYRKQIVDVITKKASEKDYSKACIEEFEKRCKELGEYLDNNEHWDIVMMYWFCLDGVQHAFYKNKLKIMHFYMMFNRYVGELSKRLSNDILLLIISDHGQKKGVHTNYGFYSSNIKLGLKNPNITDFKKIIEKQITIRND